jgi:signal transduction histidine kinase
MRPALYAWFRRHPRWVDVLIAMGPGVASVLVEGPRPGVLALAAALSLPLVVRRRQPVVVMLWVYGVGLSQLVAGWPVRLHDFSIIIAVYTVCVYGPAWAVRLALWGGITGGVLAALEWSHPPDEADRYLGMALVCSPVVVAWALGGNIRTRRAYLAGLEERAARLERERDARARAAVAEERARIARELHDVVAHNVSVMVVQADGAGCALEEGDLADTAQAIEAIGRTGRTALAEMRLLLGVLRQAEPDEGVLAPQPGLTAVHDLAGQVPLPVEITVTGEVGAAPPGVGLTAYRIVQEALTNTMKHAGPGASVTVRVDRDGDGLQIVVDDDGRGVVDDGHAPGQGLLGMRERAALFGGSVTAGARPGGGFRVAARLPWDQG